MKKLTSIYENIENPLDNEEIMKKIINDYTKSSRTNLYYSSNLYNSLVNMNETKDKSKINLNDKEAFMVESYNQWIENMISLDKNQIQYLEENKKIDANNMQQYLKKFGKVKTMKDIERLKSNPLFKKEENGWEINNGWEHIKSQYISGRKEKAIPVRHRLYIDFQKQDLWKVAKIFKNKCEENKTPFYFKLNTKRNRSDTMVIYADTKDLGKYIKYLEEVKEEYPEIVQRTEKPPMLTGKVNDWIGIGDEPPLNKDGENQSYNGLRALIFEDAIEETILNELREFFGKDVIYRGNKLRFNNIFIEQSSQSILENINKKKGKLDSIGLKEEDLSNDNFKEYIKRNLSKNINKGLNKLIKLKDKKEQVFKTNGDTIFCIPTRNGKSISIDAYSMDNIIKRMVPIFQEIDPLFMDKAKSEVQKKCRENNIDEKFCFQEGTKERFKQFDIERDKETKKRMINIKEKQGTVYTKRKDEQKELNKNNKIKNSDIVNILNPNLLRQTIKLSDNSEITAKQYVQNIVASHIPSDGKFILNDGTEIPAKKYIEDFILEEGQEKYKEDITKLLRENTKSNNGSIIINGKKINAVDIIKTINPDLLERKLKLPNNVEIPATQYIQEVVAPHIPSNGKFILKSNNLSLSAKQFIEEAVIFEGQEKYNGDINKLIESMTVANDGYITIETFIEQKKELKQENIISQYQMQQIETKKSIKKQEQERKNINKNLVDRENQKNINKEEKTIKEVKKDILNSCITLNEFNKSQKKLLEKNEMTKLMFMKRIKTPEQERRLTELQNKYETNRKKGKNKEKYNGITR